MRPTDPVLILDAIPMVLHCPECGTQHIDEPDPEKGWDNPPHRSHLCQKCSCIWRPADVATDGVLCVRTEGSADTWDPLSVICAVCLHERRDHYSGEVWGGEVVFMCWYRPHPYTGGRCSCPRFVEPSLTASGRTYDS